MDKRNKIITSLDIGTTSIKMGIAEIKSGQVNLLGVKELASQGIHKGKIVDPRSLSQVVSRLAREMEREHQLRIKDVSLAIPPKDLGVSFEKVRIDTGHPDKKLTNAHLQELVQKIKSLKENRNKMVVRVIPLDFEVDGFDKITDPLGMQGQNVKLEAVVYTLPASFVRSYLDVVEAAGLRVTDLILEPVADASLALGQAERSKGSVLINIGGGYTVASAFHEDLLKYATALPEAGDYITSDIGIVVGVEGKVAEALKVYEGYASPATVKVNEEIIIDPNYSSTMASIETSQLAEIIEARLTQILRKVKADLDSIGALKLPGGVVIVGGTSNLPGIEELAESILQRPVKTFKPSVIGARNAAYTTALGALHYQMEAGDYELLLNSFLIPNTIVESPRESEIEKDVADVVENEEESLMDRLKHMVASFFGEEQ